MVQCYIGIGLVLFCDCAAPEPACGKDVALIDAGDLFAAALGGLEGKAADTLHFGDAVVFKVPGSFHAVMDFRFAAVTKIDAANEFAHDEDIRARHDIGLQGRIGRKDRGDMDGTQVDIKP